MDETRVSFCDRGAEGQDGAGNLVHFIQALPDALHGTNRWLSHAIGHETVVRRASAHSDVAGAAIYTARTAHLVLDGLLVGAQDFRFLCPCFTA